MGIVRLIFRMGGQPGVLTAAGWHEKARARTLQDWLRMRALTVAGRGEAALAPRLRFPGIDREGLRIAPAGMHDVVAATAYATSVPGVDQVESQRRMHRNGGVQRGCSIPGRRLVRERRVFLTTCSTYYFQEDSP